jgi:RimJ/RimL family protein N-acetyltransferase
MTEAISAILGLAFRELSLHRVQLRIMEGNTASRKLAERMGFVYEGVRRDSIFVKGSYRRVHIYSMLAEEYFASARGSNAAAPSAGNAG